MTESALARPLRVLLVADPQSPTTWGWVDAVRSAGVVILGPDGKEWPEYPAVRSNARGLAARLRRWFRSFSKATPRRLAATQELRRLMGPSLAWLQGRRLRRLVDTAHPDLIHALRIPFEGMVAAAACPPGVPLAVSIWGNDLTLQAPRNPLIARATRRVLARAELLFADCQRDLDLAKTWGFRSTIPPLALPGGGGIDMTKYGESALGREPSSDCQEQESDHRIIVNARGLRQYVRNDTLLDALSVLAQEIDPRVRMVFVDASDDKNLCAEIAQHPLADKIIVTGRRSPGEMAELFRRAEVSVSITDHDGTPNSLLEAMAAGAVPVCGDIPAIREWIEHGRNGFLAAPDNSSDVASALRIAMNLSAADREAIIRENKLAIAAKAERRATGQRAAREYLRLVESRIAWSEKAMASTTSDRVRFSLAKGGWPCRASRKT